MQSHIQKGDVITVAAPAGGIASGNWMIVSNIFGVAAYSAAEGDPLELATIGVFKLAKAIVAVLTAGAHVAWNSTAKNINALGASLRAWRPRRPGLASPVSWCASTASGR
jgi:predicted RecA/RadA family phage recombinase